MAGVAFVIGVQCKELIAWKKNASMMNKSRDEQLTDETCLG